MLQFKVVLGAAAAVATVAMATYSYFSEETRKQTFLPEMRKRLAEKLNDLHQVLLNKDYPNNEIRRNALLGTCARLMGEIDDIQNEKKLCLYNTKFPKKTRDLIWHSTFFDKFDDQQIESIAVRIYNDCQAKLNQDRFQFKPDDIYENFWTKEGIGCKILANMKNVDPANAECLKAIEGYNKRLTELQKIFSDKKDCVIENCIKYIEAKIGVSASLLLSPKRVGELQELHTQNFIRKLRDAYGHFIPKGKEYRHSENAGKKNPILHAYQSHYKMDKERGSQRIPLANNFVRSDQDLKIVHDIPQKIEERVKTKKKISSCGDMCIVS